MKSVEPVFAKLPTLYGDFRIFVFSEDGKDHAALVIGDVSGKDVLCRVHSECVTGEVFGSLKCDCREQLQSALLRIGKEGRGVLVYLRQEGRGIGLRKKIEAYRVQDECGLDTVDANTAIGEEVDTRDFAVGARILKRLGVKSVRLLTNNPAKVSGLEKNGIKVDVALPTAIKPGVHNARYLRTKKTKLGHGYI